MSEACSGLSDCAISALFGKPVGELAVCTQQTITGELCGKVGKVGVNGLTVDTETGDLLRRTCPREAQLDAENTFALEVDALSDPPVVTDEDIQDFFDL